jgi:hypothetical protein
VALCMSVRMFDPQNHSLKLDSTDSTQNILNEFDFGFHPSNNRTALRTGQIAMKIILKRHSLVHDSNHNFKNVRIFTDFTGREVNNFALHIGSPCRPVVLDDFSRYSSAPPGKCKDSAFC